jgi:hypothetical protein
MEENPGVLHDGVPWEAGLYLHHLCHKKDDNVIWSFILLHHIPKRRKFNNEKITFRAAVRS